MKKFESEKDVERHVREVAQKLGGTSYKFTSPQRSNVPDRFVVVPDTPVFMIECKSEGEHPTAAQSREISRLRSYGVMVFVCDTKAAVDDAFNSAFTRSRAHHAIS